MTVPTSPEGIGVGGQGALDLTGAASSTLGSPVDRQALAQQIIQRLVQSRVGVGGGLTTGAEMSHPIMPPPPLQKSPEGVIAQGPFASVGSRKRADTQALFSNISKITQEAEKRHYDMKVQKIQHDFETLSNAMRGYEEAKASGNTAMMKHNADIANTILSDPKKSKDLAKAFDINLNPMAEGKGKGKDKPNPNQDGLKAAFSQDLKAYQNKETMLSPQTQAMMRQVPQTTQIDPATQMRMQLTEKGVLPKAGEELTFYGKIADVQKDIDNNKITNDTKMQMSQNLGKAMLNRTYMQQYGATIRTQMMQVGAKERAEIMADAWKYRADQTLKGQTDRTNVLRDKLTKSTDDNSKKLLTLMKGLDDAAQKNSKDIEDAKKNHDMERLKFLNQQADGIAFQQRMVNDKAEQQVGIDPSIPQDLKNMGLSPDEILLYQEMLKDTTQPVGAPPAEE